MLGGMIRALYVGIGGFFGAIARYLIDGWISNSVLTPFPVSTFVINVTGSFALGLFMTLATERFAIDSNLRPLIAIGFIGAYTTFSTFGLETVRLIEDGSRALSLANVALSVGVGIVAVFAGILVGRIL